MPTTAQVAAVLGKELPTAKRVEAALGKQPPTHVVRGFHQPPLVEEGMEFHSKNCSFPLLLHSIHFIPRYLFVNDTFSNLLIKENHAVKYNFVNTFFSLLYLITGLLKL